MNNNNFERFTSVSCRDGKPIVPLVALTDPNGRVPDDGQYVPRKVIERLFAYENAEEDNRMIVTSLRIGEVVFIPYYSVLLHEATVAPFLVQRICVEKEGSKVSIMYTAKSPTLIREGVLLVDESFEESSIGVSVFKYKEQADAFIEDIKRIAEQAVQKYIAIGTVVTETDRMNITNALLQKGELE